MRSLSKNRSHNSTKKTILVIGTMDTKGEECTYIKGLIEKNGFQALMIDPGTLGRPVCRADISRRDVALKAGRSLQSLLRTADKGEMIRTMTEGLTAWVDELYHKNQIAGVIAVGGGQGTAMGTSAMQVLPLGFPKVMVSTIAAGDMRPFLRTRDIAVFPSVTDVFGLNFIFSRILENAVNSVLAMAKVYRPIRKRSGNVIGATAFGVTTAGLMKMKKIFNGAGFEMVLFHANGIGGPTMEEMAEWAYFDGIMDWTTHEVMDEVAGGIFTAGKNRLHIPSKTHMPYMVAPGAIDYIVKGPYQSLSRAWKNRNHIIHNRNITLVRATPAEMIRAGKFLARRLNQAICPVKIMIPLKGFSEPNAEGKPFFDPYADQQFLYTLRKNLKNKNVEVIEMNAHINDTAFVRKAAALMMQMVK